MAHKITISELLNLSIDDLRREVRQQRITVAKLRMAVHMQKEKNTAKYTAERRQLSRMLTILTQKEKEQLPAATADTTLSAPKAS